MPDLKQDILKNLNTGNCEGDDCTKDTGVVVKARSHRREKALLQKKLALFIKRVEYEKCKDDKIVRKNSVFPNDYLLPVNMSDFDIDLQQQTKSNTTANSPMPYNTVTGYNSKVDFNSIWTEDGAWADFLWSYAADLPMGDEAEVEVLIPMKYHGKKTDEKGRIIGATSVDFLHFTGPMDLDKFMASGNEEDISNLKASISVNYDWEILTLKPDHDGDWDGWIKGLNSAKGLGSIWDNDCATKIIDVKNDKK